MFLAQSATGDYNRAENEHSQFLSLSAHELLNVNFFFFFLQHKKKLQLSVRTLHTNFIQHSWYFIEHTNLSREVKIFFWVYIPGKKNQYKDFSSEYLFLTSTKSEHSVKIYLMVVTVLHATQTGGFSLLLLLLLLLLLFKITGMYQIRVTSM